MNFFGHATVATWYRSEPGYVLGSMLPDFASMVTSRVAGVDDRSIDEGVALHHRTDAVFHTSPIFQRWCVRGSAALAEAGVRRGTARAAAHIGPELILDAWLAERFDASSHYRSALRIAAPHALGRSIRWEAPDGHARFDQLRERLLRFAEAPPDDAPDVLVFRLTRALDRRPQLAVAPEDVPALTRWLAAVRAEVRDEAGALIDALARGLDERRP